MDHNKLWKVPPPHLPPEKPACRPRSNRTRNGTGSSRERGISCQGCMLSSCLFNLYAEYNMHNVELDETQAGIKTAGRDINNLR